jgi:hypothetical protein
MKSASVLMVYAGMAFLLLFNGCDWRSVLEKTSTRLKPRMNRAEVDQLFTNFKAKELTEGWQIRADTNGIIF